VPGREERELIPVFALLWIAGAVRVGACVLRGEAFGTEASLAGLAVAAVPVLLWRPVASLFALRKRCIKKS
jgi:hypothetical protein